MSSVVGPYGFAPVFSVDAANSKSYPGSGTTWVDSINGNNLTAYNSPTYSNNNNGVFTTTVAGSQYFAKVTTAADSLDISSALTISIWFRANAWATYAYLIAKNTNSGYGDHQYALNYDAGAGLVFQLGATNLVYTLFGAPLTWQHIVAIWDGTTASVYRNGSFAVSTPVSGPLPFRPNFTISGRPTVADLSGSVYYFDGNIASVQIGNAAITAQDVGKLFNAERGRFGI